MKSARYSSVLRSSDAKCYGRLLRMWNLCRTSRRHLSTESRSQRRSTTGAPEELLTMEAGAEFQIAHSICTIELEQSNLWVLDC
jgi:hypothetical protein